MAVQELPRYSRRHRGSLTKRQAWRQAQTSDAGRKAIAEAVFERIDVRGVNAFTSVLTAHAKARGWDAAFGAGVVAVKEGQSGRGERTSAETFQLSVRIVGGNIHTDVEIA